MKKSILLILIVFTLIFTSCSSGPPAPIYYPEDSGGFKAGEAVDLTWDVLITTAILMIGDTFQATRGNQSNKDCMTAFQ